VCGKRNAVVIPEKKGKKNLIEFTEDKMIFELNKN
jgi:hypothetical protein